MENTTESKVLRLRHEIESYDRVELILKHLDFEEIHSFSFKDDEDESETKLFCCRGFESTQVAYIAFTKYPEYEQDDSFRFEAFSYDFISKAEIDNKRIKKLGIKTMETFDRKSAVFQVDLEDELFTILTSLTNALY